jgi:hypothetical protein
LVSCNNGFNFAKAFCRAFREQNFGSFRCSETLFQTRPSYSVAQTEALATTDKMNILHFKATATNKAESGSRTRKVSTIFKG